MKNAFYKEENGQPILIIPFKKVEVVCFYNNRYCISLASDMQDEGVYTFEDNEDFKNQLLSYANWIETN